MTIPAPGTPPTLTASPLANGAAKFATFVPFDDATLGALEVAHGRIAVVRAAAPARRRWVANDAPEPPWEAVFRQPTVGESEAFEGHAHHEKGKAGALRNHAKATVVGVSIGGKQTTCTDRRDAASVKAVREAWDDLRDRFGGAHLAAQDDLQALMGMVTEEGKDE